MAGLITDSRLDERLIDQRRAWGADHHDEVWEGVYMMVPLPNNEHQQIVFRLASILDEVVGDEGLGEVLPGVNLAGSAEDWEHDYRCPDVVVFLRNTKATNCDAHWRGGADFVVEVASSGDRTREKIDFYSRIGVRELLILDRHPWRLELYRQQDGRLEITGRATVTGNESLSSTVVPLRFRLVSGSTRPRIEVTHVETGRQWLA